MCAALWLKKKSEAEITTLTEGIVPDDIAWIGEREDELLAQIATLLEELKDLHSAVTTATAIENAQNLQGDIIRATERARINSAARRELGTGAEAFNARAAALEEVNKPSRWNNH